MTILENILQHFRKDEQPFIERVFEWKKEVQDHYAPKLTDFLDPREQFIVQSIVGTNEDILVFGEGVFEEAERKRILIAPSYFVPTLKDFEMKVLKLTYPSKFIQLKHPDMLGALLALGIDRNKFGDIRIHDEEIQFTCTKEMALYVKTNLMKVGKVKVHIEELISMEELIPQQEEWIEKSITVSSMRLDVVLSNSFNISRQKSQQLVRGGKVKVNFTICEEPSFDLEDGDMISCRGFGRFKILLIEGRTKKEKIRVLIGLLEKK